jgi:hypothetical protein
MLAMKILSAFFTCISVATLLTGCTKEEYEFGEIKTPSNLVLTTIVEGANAANPEGNGTGKVSIKAAASNAITYKIDFGDGNEQMVPSGDLVYKFTEPGTKEYTITATAVGTAGVTTVVSKKVKVFVRFEIPANIVTALTNNSSKNWETDKAADGHFGVGPTDQFAPIWYSATPNSREACAYDDLINFSVDAAGNISINVDNKGASFSIADATAFYGFSGPDGCYAINTGGTKRLAFLEANTGSTTSNSTKIEFSVPGNGIVNFGTGAKNYEILSITPTQLHLRSVGVTGLAWYMKLKAK